jgi:hypothetical protein
MSLVYFPPFDNTDRIRRDEQGEMAVGEFTELCGQVLPLTSGIIHSKCVRLLAGVPAFEMLADIFRYVRTYSKIKPERQILLLDLLREKRGFREIYLARARTHTSSAQPSPLDPKDLEDNHCRLPETRESL